MTIYGFYQNKIVPMSDMHLSKLKEISAGTNYESPNGMNYAAHAFNKN